MYLSLDNKFTWEFFHTAFIEGRLAKYGVIGNNEEHLSIIRFEECSTENNVNTEGICNTDSF